MRDRRRRETSAERSSAVTAVRDERSSERGLDRVREAGDRLLRCESCKVFGHKTCQSKVVHVNSKPQVWVVKPTHVAPIVAEVLSPIVNDVVGVAASASPVSVSVVSVSVVVDGTVERIPTVVDIKKKVGIDGAAYLKVLDFLVSSFGTKFVNSFSNLQNLDSGEDKPDSGAEPITLLTDEEFVPLKRREGSQ
ncbi:hypothetical protein RHSIM_Rhsim11G0053500 [Rhododendron simsii]|uniref:Uncharacterized protein n=1 Tax=Rhododendron simsii TaxID=118357 RepID=A0A834LAS6_RHOSS|nr:hypothetical protein RHSIM_Rhsim11G0053500 [Rhododendron simsii]